MRPGVSVIEPLGKRTDFASPGARWVERFLLPKVADRLPQATARPLAFLQLAPDDDSEADHLRALGHTCDLVLAPVPASGTFPSAEGRRDPGIDVARGEQYDVIFSGAFGRFAPSARARIALGHLLFGVCRPGGAVLLTMGNRRCPVDLSGNAAPLHSPWAASLLSLVEAQQLFVATCGFRSVEPLSLEDQHAGSTLGGAKRAIRKGLFAYLRWVSDPGHQGRYASPLNPMLALWIAK
jgi:hypothetical protein